MPKLLDWIDDKKQSTWVLTSLLIAAHVSIFLFPDVMWVVLSALVVSILCPFAIFLVWIIDSVFIERIIRRRWTSVLLAGGIVTYGMIANTFASDLINTHFMVDPSHFTVTTIFLTTAYLLVGVFQPLVMFPIWLALVLLGTFIVPVLLLMGPGKQMLKRVGIFFAATLIISTSTRTLDLLRIQLPLLAEKVALAADFNQSHRCTAQWDSNIDRVIFLNDGHVLGHVAGTSRYEVLPCYGGSTR